MDIKEYEIKRVLIKDIKLDDSNPNSMDDSMKKRLSDSMGHFGNTQPVIIDSNTMILADGEHRLKEYISQGLSEIPAILLPFKSDAERRAYRQAANKIRGEHSGDMDIKEYLKIIEGGAQDILKMATGMDIIEVQEHIRKCNQIIEKEFDENIEIKSICPKCGYKW